jgi:translation initiation factor IF-2
VRTSAIKGEGIQDLLEILDLQASCSSSTADFGGPARGTSSSRGSRRDAGRSPTSSSRTASCKVGDFIVAGRGFGRVRDITDDRGKRSMETPDRPTPVQISGIDELPDAGDKFYIVDSLKKAQQAAEQRRTQEREEQLAQPKVTLDNDVQPAEGRRGQGDPRRHQGRRAGLVDVLKHEVEKVSTDEVKVRVLHAAVGGITESDVILAEASKAVIVGFNVIPSGKARSAGRAEGRRDPVLPVIYDITDDMKKAAEGCSSPSFAGSPGPRRGASGLQGLQGRHDRRLLRHRRHRPANAHPRHPRRHRHRERPRARAAQALQGRRQGSPRNMECGMKIVGYDDIKEGDILECYKQVEVKRTL